MERRIIKARAGKNSRRTFDLTCSQCDQKRHVVIGELIPRCACGSDSYQGVIERPSLRSLILSGVTADS